MMPLTPGEPLAMTDTKSGGRPRAKTMVRLDLYNAYARLGVSPLLPTDEIKEVINRKRKEVMRQRRTRGEQQFGKEDAEMTRLQAIEDEIGTPRSRARYDRLNPQNALLTIQPGRHDICLQSKDRAGLATAWVAPVSREPGTLGAAGARPRSPCILDCVHGGERPRSTYARGRRIGSPRYCRARAVWACRFEPKRPAGGGGTVPKRTITRAVTGGFVRCLIITA
jgi:hypothetical protein